MSWLSNFPPLPYDYEALQPYMSKETLEFHHDKHHQAYVTNGNNLLKGSGLEDKSLEEVVKQSYSKNAGLFNNAGQHYNHIHFWKWMKKGGGGKKHPRHRSPRLIDSDLGGYDKFRTDFIQAGVTQFGSGWAWVAVRDGKLDDHEDAERREPARPRRHADPRRRRVGALLLHRLPQRPAEIPRGVRRQSDQLGLRARALREGDEPRRRLNLANGAGVPAGVNSRRDGTE